MLLSLNRRIQAVRIGEKAHVLKNIDFAEGAPVLKLSLGEGEQTIYAGDASSRFAQAEPFSFLGIPA